MELPFDPPRPGLSRLGAEIVARLHGLRGRRLIWGAFAFGTGVGLYFGLPVEPGPVHSLAALTVCVALLAAAWFGRHGAGLLALLAAIVLLGGLAAQLRANAVAGPVLGFRYYGAVEGRIVVIDRSGSGAVRLTLDRVRLDGVAPARTPTRVRISLQEPGSLHPEPGLRVMTTAHLSPPPGPTEPGGFDFQRHAFFKRLGALGYGAVPLMLADEARDGAMLTRIRRHIAEGLRARMPGPRGEVAAAITTGDRSGLPDDVVNVLRISNLAHLLAISGLHMGLLVGFTFWVVRGGLALFPRIALTHPTRAWAALAALPVAAIYLALSGSGIATQRAFVMAVVMLGAILAGRRALSMRSVAIAALIVLALRPESLIGPGFQMSFAATGALILAFGWLQHRDARWRSGLMGAGVGLILSSAVAGFATAPIAAAHFSRVGQYGLIANLFAVPAMGVLVMPLLFLGLLLWPLGLEAPALAMAGWGIDWIILVARSIAALPGALGTVTSPPEAVLPLIGLAMGWLAAAVGAARLLALAPALAAALIWGMAVRPHVLISDDGRLVGIETQEGRALSHPRGASFVARAWLEHDGDLADQETAAARSWPREAAHPLPVVARGKRRFHAALAECRPGGAERWIVTDQIGVEMAGCHVLGADDLRETGAIALTVINGEVVQRTAAEAQGARPWTGHGLWRAVPER